MDAALTRDTLGRLLAEENAALSEFATLLDKEHVALRGRDIDALEALAEARQASVVKLLKIEEERRSLCSMLGYDTDLAGLAKLHRLVRSGPHARPSVTRNAPPAPATAATSTTATASWSERRSSASKGCWAP